VIHEACDDQDGADRNRRDAGRLPSPHGPLPLGPSSARLKSSPYADRVDRLEACLVDVYETLLSCDFTRIRGALPKLAGVDADAWREMYRDLIPALTLGRLTKAEAFARIMAATGVQPRPDLLRDLSDRDRELLVACSRLYDDAVPFLKGLRSRGIKIAIVSNCSEHTHDMLDEIGVAALADVLVLSCEVGAAKPDAEIFRFALDSLGVSAGTAAFVDDQASYCAGAAAMGISAVQLVRGEVDGAAGHWGFGVVRSLPEAETMLFG
jgi:putative hydrolase of the HAD superfamily